MGSLILSLIALGTPSMRYVDATAGRCDDAGAGSTARPWCSLTAAGKKARPGDVVLIRSGVYRGQWKIEVSGRAGKPIQFRAAPGGQVVIDGTGTKLDDEGLVYVYRRQHVQLQGITIRDSSFYAVQVSGSRHVTLDRLKIVGTMHGGVVFDHGCSNVSITRSDISRTHRAGQDDGTHEGITISNCRQFLVAENHVHHGQKEGIDAKDGARDGIIRDNVVSHMGQVGIYLNHATRVKVQRNRIHDNGYSGIQLAVGDNAEGAAVTSDNEISQNLIWNNGYSGVEFWREKRGQLGRNRILNNVLYRNRHCGVDLGDDAYGTVVRNNIIAGNRQTSLRGSVLRSSGNVFSHNLYFQNGSQVIIGGDNVTADPRFVAPERGNFSVQAGSPAIDRGTPVGLPHRGRAPDLGAIEFGAKTARQP